MILYYAASLQIIYCCIYILFNTILQSIGTKLLRGQTCLTAGQGQLLSWCFYDNVSASTYKGSGLYTIVRGSSSNQYNHLIYLFNKWGYIFQLSNDFLSVKTVVWCLSKQHLHFWQAQKIPKSSLSGKAQLFSDRTCFLLKYTIGQSPSSYYCNKTDPTTISKASGSTTNSFVKSGSFKTGEQHNSNLSYSKHYTIYNTILYYLVCY